MASVRRCCIPDCLEDSESGYSLFSFPRDPVRCSQWVTNCSRQDLTEKQPKQLNRSYQVCAKHFRTEMFAGMSQSQLKRFAIPTIFGTDVPQQALSSLIGVNLRNRALRLQGLEEKYSEKPVSSKRNISNKDFCNDSFSPTMLEEDMENFMEWKMMGVQKRMKKNIVPHKFDKIKCSPGEKCIRIGEGGMNSLQPKKENSEILGTVDELMMDNREPEGRPQTVFVSCDSVDEDWKYQNIVDLPTTIKQENLDGELSETITDFKVEEDITQRLEQLVNEVKTEIDEPSLKVENEIYSEAWTTRQAEVDIKIEVETGSGQAQPEIKTEKDLEGMLDEWNLSAEIVQIKTEMEDSNSLSNVPEREECKPETSKEKVKQIKAKYRCNECCYQTRWRYSLTRHQLSHKSPSDVELFKCDECNYQTIRKDKLNWHLLSHKNHEELHKCCKCSYLTTHKSTLKKHMVVHYPEEIAMHQCPGCDYKARRKDRLRHHLKTCHEDPSDVTCYVTHKCEQCDFQTRHKNNLLRHNRCVHKSTPETFKCFQCDYQTVYKDYLKRHMHCHQESDEIKIHYCPECVYKTRFKSSLTKHLLCHKDPKDIVMYKCSQCDFQTKLAQSLKRHIRCRHRSP